MTSSAALQMSLADVARLAGVQRPVVSMWRRRELVGHPFPRPVSVVGSQERFDAVEIADYLAATGRGNGTLEREDVAAHATLAGVEELDEETLFDGLTALLALDVLTGASLSELAVQELCDLAHETDPHDNHLVREIDALGATATVVAQYAAALADASFSPVAAFETLLRQQLHRGLPVHAAVAHRREVVTLAGLLAAELAMHEGWSNPLFVDVTDGSGDLLLEAARAHGETATVATLAADTRSSRLVRRRINVHDLHRVDATIDRNGDLQLADQGYDGTVHLVQLPPIAPQGLSDVQLLELVDDMLIQLDENARMVVVGPASALTDPPRSPETDRARDAVLRGGRLRTAIRLPAGLLVRQPRLHLALWVLGPAHPDVPIAERWTVVGDLSDARLDEATIEDVLTDVLAAMAGPRQAVAHAYRFARPVLTANLIAGRGSLVVRPSRASGAVRVTVQDAVRRFMCRIVAGNRVSSEDLISSGRPVIGPEELLGGIPLGSRAVDPLTFAAGYASARYTEPGDVIFCTTPGIAAWVDRDGGSVVRSPARVLRIDAQQPGGAALVPEVVAADINAATSKGWRGWTLRIVPTDRRTHLADELDRLAAERAQLLTRLAELDSLQDHLITDATRTRPEGL